jgi:NAD(P)-dependent dehydrogenase (short-subunit alcohol dehydrogenase family)
MNQRRGDNKCLLITGGTSGLGFELAKCFLAEGYEVIATGRQTKETGGFNEKFLLYTVDFGDLGKVAETTAIIVRNHSVGMIINNAGILSPPSYTETIDGLEYTFQVNFLAHLLIAEIILQSHNDENDLIIASVTSPMSRFAGKKPGITEGPLEYNPIRAYSSSKLYLAMMQEFLKNSANHSSFHCFSLDPGTFSSSIYRMQKRWFRTLYLIAAPFMRTPARVAKGLTEILLRGDHEDGMIYDISNRKKAVPQIEQSSRDALIARCHALIDPYLRHSY